MSINNLPLLLLGFMFFTELQFTRILGERENARLMLMVVAVVQFATVYCLVLFYLGREALNGSRQSLEFAVPGKGIFFLFAGYFAVALTAGLIGFYRGHDFSYTLGDIFKFAFFPVIVLVMCISIPSIKLFHRLLFVTIIIYAVFLLKCLIEYVTGYLDFNQRPVSIIYIYPFMPLLWMYLRAKTGNSPVLIATGAILAVAFPMLIWYTQSLSLVLQATFVLTVSWVLYRGPGAAAKKAVVIGMLLLVIGIDIVYYHPLIIDNMVKSITGTDLYLTRKLSHIRVFGWTPRTLELITGSRLAELIIVVSYFYEKPLELIAGQGMGSFLEVVSVTGLEDKPWEVAGHFIEGGYPEVLYRTGIVGLVLYVLIFLALFRKAYNLSRGNYFCAMTAAYSLYVLIFSFLNMGYLGQGFGSFYMVSILFTGTYLIDRESKKLLRHQEGE